MNNLLKLLDCFAGLSVVVWGDFVADEYIYGESPRVSREAPVLILKERKRRIAPGGAANAAANLAAVGIKVRLVGTVGTDSRGDQLVEQFERLRMDTSALERVDRPTPTKTRILAAHSHTSHQQVVRVDCEPDSPLDTGTQARLYEQALRLAGDSNAMLISDYGYDNVTPRTAGRLRRELDRSIALSVDARYQITAYTDMTAATPNEPEVEEALHVRIGNDLGALEDAGRALLGQIRCQSLLVTRGREGMALFEPDRPTVHIPIHGSDQAVDVTGAGDTVIALFTAGLAAGADAETAARLANVAGGIVVMKRGTATASPEELRAAINK